MNITSINFTDFQIKNTNIFNKDNNDRGFLDFNRTVVRVYLKRTTFVNLLIIDNPTYSFIMVTNSKDLVFVDSIMTQNFSGGKILYKSSLNL